MALIIAIAVLATIGLSVAIAAGVRVRRVTDEAWQQAASQLGFVNQPGGWFGSRAMAGSLERIDVVVDTYTQRSGNTSTTFTRVTASYPDLGLGLSIRRETGIARFAKAFGAQDIEVGDESFDTAVIVKGDVPDEVRAFLTPARVLSIQRLIDAYPGTAIEDTAIIWTKSGVLRDAAKLVSAARRVAAVARSVARPTSRAAKAALDAQRAGDLGRAAELAQTEIEAPDETDVSTRMLAAETLYAAGRTNAAADAFAALEGEMPADPDVRGWLERTKAAPRSAAAADIAAAIDDPRPVAEALFAPSNLSFRTMEIFETDYAGRTVEWSGVLREVSAYTKDATFGKEAGTKAVVEILSVEHELYGSIEIDAVVQLGPETAPALESRRGQTVSFRGRLAHCDPLFRNLYVADAVLVGGH